MPLIAERFRAPSIREHSFNCPHCGALAKQFWYNALGEEVRDGNLPIRFTVEEADAFSGDIEDKKAKETLRDWAKRVAIGFPFMETSHRDPYAYTVNNVSFSKCYNCKEVGVWIGDKLAWPMVGETLPPNPDLSLDVKRDYEEAAAVIDASPRAAAALLRLAIQKMCVELGGAGRNLNDDIAALVSRGLDIRVQQALDVVRVIGNNAVHPGELDLRDDRATAERLFQLVNLVADVLISQPKHVASMFAALPDGAKRAVEARDKRN